jgi:hypothetical protein
MLPALARWRDWPSSRRPVRRWRLAERFRQGRIDERRRPAGTFFRHEGRAVHLVSRQLTLRPLTYAPQFQLAFHAHSQPIQRSETQPRQRLEEPLRSRTRLVMASRLAAEAEASEREIGPRIPRGLGMTFAPISGVVTNRSATATEPAIRAVAESVVERVIRGHQRIESRQRTAVVVREQPQVAIEIERALTSVSKRAAESAMETPAMGTIWPANSPFATPNGPDLDHLTDQIVRRIDDRLTAQRERMGRF